MISERPHIRTTYKVTSDIISLDILDIYIINPGIVIMEFKQEGEFDLDLAKKSRQLIGELTNGEAYPTVFFAYPGLTVTEETREWGNTESAQQYNLMTAIICNSLAHRILANFFINVQKPSRPTKMFSNIDNALKWINSSVK